MSTRTQHEISPAGSVRRPWLWQVWAAIVIAFAIALAAHFALNPPLAISPPAITNLGNTYTVSFSATNNTDKRVTANLLIIAGIGRGSGKSGRPIYTEFARRPVSVKLWPKERKNLSLDFPIVGWPRPNTARVEIVSSER